MCVFQQAERQMWTESLPVSWNLRARGPLDTGKEVDCLLIWCQGGNEMTLAREPGRPPFKHSSFMITTEMATE